MAKRASPDVLQLQEACLGVLERVATTISNDVPRRPATDSSKGQRERIEAVKVLLATRFRENLTLATIGRHVSLSPYHLARVFRRHEGTSIHQHLVRVRLRAGFRFLAEGFSDLTRLAQHLGFADHAHFTRSFRREFGVPPSVSRAKLTDLAAASSGVG